VLLLWTAVNGLLRVTNPQSLYDKFKETNGIVDSAYAEFGHIPYG
jgi:hypothetical protein